MADDALDHEPIDYRYGSMDITEQRATFNIIMRLVKWVSLWIAGLLLFLTIAFSTELGWFTGLIAGIVLMVAGYFLLKAKNESDRPH